MSTRRPKAQQTTHLKYANRGNALCGVASEPWTTNLDHASCLECIHHWQPLWRRPAMLAFIALCAAVVGGICIPVILLAGRQTPTPIAASVPPARALTVAKSADLAIQEIYWRIDAIAVNHPGVQYQQPTDVDIWKGCLSLLLEAKGLPPYDWGLAVRDQFVGSIIGEAAKQDWPDFCRVRNGAGGDWERVGTGKWDQAISKWGPKRNQS